MSEFRISPGIALIVSILCGSVDPAQDTPVTTRNKTGATNAGNHPFKPMPRPGDDAHAASRLAFARGIASSDLSEPKRPGAKSARAIRPMPRGNAECHAMARHSDQALPPFPVDLIDGSNQHRHKKLQIPTSLAISAIIRFYATRARAGRRHTRYP